MIKTQPALKFLLFLSLLFPLPGFAADGDNKTIYVAKTGNDANNGSIKAPLLTISKAENLAHPGDRIVVHKGIYRETVVLNSGGTALNSRITFVAAPGEEVVIKGSEQVRSWVKEKGRTWCAEINESFFKGFNPFARLVSKDSSFIHLGEVYLQNKPLKEQKDVNQVEATQGSWFTTQDNGKTIIIANFGNIDPNTQLTEINVRPAAFTAQKQEVNYIVLDGFKISQIASPMAFVNGEQTGAITLNGGTYWLIQNCTLSDCKSVAISIGQTGHAYPGAGPGKPEYSDLSKDITTVGHEIVKHNHIFRCGQAGIFGLLHGTFSEITNNLIEDINSNDSYPGEIAGIHLVVAIDVLIDHNLIRSVNGYGLFMGPLFQGAHISRNIITGTKASCLYFYNSHGPALIDNNILAGTGKQTGEGVSMMSAEANVFAQNLFYNCGFINEKVPGRSFATSNYLAHTLIIKQTIPVLPFDDRWYNNVFIKDGLNQLTPNADCLADYNVYLDGASGSSWGDKLSKSITGNTGFKLINTAKSISLIFNGKTIPKITSPVLSPEFIGFFTLSKQYIEYPDGKTIAVNKDFTGVTASKTAKPAGPFYQYPAEGSKGQLLFTY